MVWVNIGGMVIGIPVSSPSNRRGDEIMIECRFELVARVTGSVFSGHGGCGLACVTAAVRRGCA